MDCGLTSVFLLSWHDNAMSTVAPVERASLPGYRLGGCGGIASDILFTFGQLLINITFCFLHREIRILEQCINVKLSKAILRLWY